jgi:hypothetical protein
MYKNNFNLGLIRISRTIIFGLSTANIRINITINKKLAKLK